ncbi:MAG: hypothetical protein OHK0029_12480 [Armatimonadaceae bacterium]
MSVRHVRTAPRQSGSVNDPDPAAPNPESGRDAELLRLAKRFSPGGIRRQRTRQTFRTFVWFGIVQPLTGAKRFVDFLVAFGLLVLLGPLLVVLRLGTGPLTRFERLGRWGEPFTEYELTVPQKSLLRSLRIHRLPVLLNIVKGDMSFIGPRVVSPCDLTLREREAQRRYDVRPGVICLWWIRRRANIAYDTEALSDHEYVESQTLKSDLGIALRAIPAILYGEGVATAPDTVTLLGIPVDNVTMTEAVEWITERLDQRENPAQVSFVNADCANIAYKNTAYRSVLQDSEFVLADGIGMKLAGKLLRREIKQNVNGTDLFPRLCAALEGTEHSIYFLGGQPEIPERVAQWVQTHYPQVRIAGTQHGYFAPEDEGAVIQQIRASGASLLLVAFGAPRQDMWVAEHLAATGVAVGMGVGGLFDFYSGNKPRAPQWVREMGMEWLFRLLVEPRRLWKRYVVGNVIFLSHVLRERLHGGEGPMDGMGEPR